MKQSGFLLATFALAAASAQGQVTINEFVYDDSGTDSLEFVELYNAGASAVDISGWTVEGADTAVDVTATIPASTSIAAGDYYVIGMGTPSVAGYVPVPNVDFDTVAPTDLGDFQNDTEALTLKNGSTVVDSVVYERWAGTVVIPAGLGEPAFDGVSGTSGGGIWGTLTLIEVGTGTGINDPMGVDPSSGSFSWQRHSDGYDTGDNDKDFGAGVPTPGEANHSKGVVTLPYTNNFDAADGGNAATTWVPQLPGSFWSVSVQDPTIADAGTPAGSTNPSAIAASPQGGNVGLFWDNTGGGNAGLVNLAAPVANVEIECYIYLDTAQIAQVGATAEEYTVFAIRGRGDSNAGSLEPGNGDYGLRWKFRKSNAAAGSNVTLTLEEKKNGVTTTIGSAINVATTGWQRLVLSANGTDVVGIYGGTLGSGATTGQIVQGTATITQAGGIGFTYREAISAAGNPGVRPLTIDALTIRTPTVSGVNEWSLY